ncbi:hypothetical protein ABGB09_34235 [Streptomyces sp. B8F3]|uniref:hypothetical protein n=1 Tax=Streptomyces sp. B8F3 TaxID=3153573 RepID=UPI00325C706C
MSRHKRVRVRDQEQDESQDLPGLGLWPLVWLIVIVIAIPVVVLEDPARGAEPPGTCTSAAPAVGNTADRW